MRTIVPTSMRDHPRSRGVYPHAVLSCSQPFGSSPLARGLLFPGIGVICLSWIIPARAGFTISRQAVLCDRLDHPRSRGVYSAESMAEKVSLGSSPLARGLPPFGLIRLASRRIIPARAGFTKHTETRLNSADGSSPLARGLPCHTTTSGIKLKDHPRSRGVYEQYDCGTDIESGSSPLARGLLPRDVAEINIGRIIPARAGFTWRTLSSSASWWDHPRSRGVYFSRALLLSPLAGSSPLARGLRPL